jgi:hypothetical protein
MNANQIEALKIWKDRDVLVEAKIDAYSIVDVLDRYNAVHEMREQVDLLANLAEAVEAGADVLYSETVTYAFDPRTPAQKDADLLDAEVKQTQEYAL